MSDLFFDSIVAIIGNDGTGKTTLVKTINDLNCGVHAFERSTKPHNKYQELHDKINFKSIDKLTLLTTVKEQYYEYDFINEIDGKRVYYIIVDSDVPTIVKRVSGRTGDAKGIFEEEKSLIYFRERFEAIGHYFGFPVVLNQDCTVDDTVCEIIRIIRSNVYDQIQSCKLKEMNYDSIYERLYDNVVDMTEFDCNEIFEIINSGSFLRQIFDDIEKHNLEGKDKLYEKIAKRYVASKQTNFDNVANIKTPYFRLVTEGESKQVFEIISNNKYLNFYIIVLKPTIYSHSKQACGEIKDLEKTRASGTQLILEMMWRNNCKHTYYAMNNYGVAHSRIIQTTPIEIVFKKYCIGTDKHSYYDMISNQKCVIKETGEYMGGPYVRFDWRNPNQVTDGHQLNSYPFYYLFESFIGKEKFFDEYLRHEKSWGDKTVNEDILDNIFDVDVCKKIILRVYNTIQYYCNEVGLNAKDGCFMIDSDNERIWSEINPDCMRIVGTDGTLYDKDIWRAQGDSAKRGVVTQWNSFNKIFTDYFDQNPFIETELCYDRIYKYRFHDQIVKLLSDHRLKISHKYRKYYEELLKDCPISTKTILNIKHKKEAVFTIDMYDKQPVLVQRGKIYTVHSNGNPYEALEKIKIANNIFIADLNGAIDGTTNVNRDIIKHIATQCHIYTGGGIRSISDVQDLLEASTRRVTVSTMLDFLPQLPQKVRNQRITVELSINESGKIMTHGRKVTTDINILDKIHELVSLDITAISITFHQAEGMMNGLPRDQITNLIQQIPFEIEKIFIAGGVSSLDDLNFLWQFPRVVPQLGSVVWKNILSVGTIIAEMGKYDENGLIPAIIQATTGKILGLIYMNKESIQKSVDTKELWRYSRKHKKLMHKGDESGNTQQVVHISYDCDNDAILVTVDDAHPFCHLITGGKHCLSCFNSQCHKFNTEIIDRWIYKSTGSYSSLMKRFPGLAFSKLLEEIDELWSAKEYGYETLVKESSDVYAHFLMYLKSINISQHDIMNELGRRHYDPKLLTTSFHKSYSGVDDRNMIVGITGDKYASYTDNFILDNFGIKIIRQTGRKLDILYEIVDKVKYDSYFENKTVSFVGLKPKDMTRAMIYKLLNAVVTYNVTLDNLPTVFNVLTEKSNNDIKLCLLKRIDSTVDVRSWTPINKGKIATEHPTSVSKYFASIGVSSDCYSLHKISGSSESFLVNKTNVEYDLCDAIVSSGKTLEENNLEIFDIIVLPEDVKVVYAEMITI